VNAIPRELTTLPFFNKEKLEPFISVYNTNDTSERGDLPARTEALPSY